MGGCVWGGRVESRGLRLSRESGRPPARPPARPARPLCVFHRETLCVCATETLCVCHRDTVCSTETPWWIPRTWTGKSELAEPGTPRSHFLDEFFTKWVAVKDLGTFGTAFCTEFRPGCSQIGPDGHISTFGINSFLAKIPKVQKKQRRKTSQRTKTRGPKGPGGRGPRGLGPFSGHIMPQRGPRGPFRGPIRP